MTKSKEQILKGWRTLVTGGSKGIGRSIALTLAETGADVAILARNKIDLYRV